MRFREIAEDDLIDKVIPPQTPVVEEEDTSNKHRNFKTFRSLFERLAVEMRPISSTSQIIDEVTKQGAERTESGNWRYIAGNRKKPFARKTLEGYLHGKEGNNLARIAPDLIADLRPKKKEPAVKKPMVSLARIETRLIAIEQQNAEILKTLEALRKEVAEL